MRAVNTLRHASELDIESLSNKGVDESGLLLDLLLDGVSITLCAGYILDGSVSNLVGSLPLGTFISFSFSVVNRSGYLTSELSLSADKRLASISSVPCVRDLSFHRSRKMVAWCSTSGAVESCRLTGLVTFFGDPMPTTADLTFLNTGKFLTTNGESVPDIASRVIGISLFGWEGSSICKRGNAFLMSGWWLVAGTS